MAIQDVKCPNCGGEVQMDDSLENGFCMYCGGAIHIEEEIEKIQIEHKGKVEIDDSKKLTNSIELANRAFSSGNYDECYDYCCTALECDINNYHMAFRKGLCAAYLSVSRATELEQAVKTAVKLIKSTSNDVDDEIHTIFSELFEYIRSTYTLDCNRERGFKYPSLAAANNTFSIVANLTKLSEVCSDLISTEMMIARPDFENDKRACLEQGLDLCELGLSSLKYFAGYRQVKRGDKYFQQEVYESVKSPSLEMHKRCQIKFKEDFNNLPSTKKALMEYDGEIAELQKDIDTFNQNLEEYFDKNPTIGKEYKKKIWPFIIIAVVFFSCAFAGFQGFSNTTGFMGIIANLVVIVWCLALGIFALIKIRGITKKRKDILNALPTYLLNLKNVHDESQSKLKAVKQTKAVFVKNNVKK